MTHEARRFGTTDTHLTPIALGAMLMGTQTPEDESRKILDHYIGEVTPRYTAPDGTTALGMIDTANCYCWWEVSGDFGGHSESVLGHWMADAGTRDQVFLATKGTAILADLDGIWPDGPDGNPNWDLARTKFQGAAPEVLRTALAESLERLQVDKVDLYYNHVDDRATPLVDAVGTYNSFVEDGRVGAYGWSNVTTWRLAEIRETAKANGWALPAALQQQHTYLRRRAGLDHHSIVSEEQMDFLREYPDLQLVAYSPILKGLFNKPDERADHWAMPPYAGPDADARFAAVEAAAKKSGATPTQVVLAWMLAGDSPSIVPLIGPRTFDQYTECIDALDVELDAGTLEELNEAGA